MAKKKKGPRQDYGLVCTKCKNFNYITTRNKVNTPEKLALSKYCKHCRATTDHKETAKLK
jgi:large subunit ribosomal protein L33